MPGQLPHSGEAHVGEEVEVILINDNDLAARRGDLRAIDAALSWALQSDPDKRDLERVISELMMYNSPLLVLVDSLTAFEVIIAPRLRPDNFRTLYLPDSTPTL